MTPCWDMARRIALIMEAVRTSEATVYFNVTTRRYIPEICHILIRRRENLNFTSDLNVRAPRGVTIHHLAS
jgi:hypothetical protein